MLKAHRLKAVGLDRVMETKGQRNQRQILEELRKDMAPEGLEEWQKILRLDLAKINACATDALRFLDRSEPLLRERRRNVWWTTWYFERRLRAMSYILWTSVVEHDKPIPFLGLESAMRLSDTIADNLLNDASRMIRVDAYRFAMVLLEYASCARALRLRLVLDRKTVWLEGRLTTMSQNLRDAMKQLEEITNLRTKGVSSPTEKVSPSSAGLRSRLRDKGLLADDVLEIIRQVMMIAEDVASDLDRAKRDQRFTRKEIIEILEKGKAGVETTELCHEHGISASTFYAWRSKYGKMDVADA